MTHKVTILNIEHVEHANRIIIKYNLCCDSSNTSSQGWVYIPEACGYKGICDTDWICMTPNTQHPLHSDVIKTAGDYYYVWDYHGVNGLSNESFSSEHSFVVQIALQDAGCTWVDPCVNNPNLTPDGNLIEGDIGFSGNCGTDYIIGHDEYGCLVCLYDPLCDNTVPTGPNIGAKVQGAVGSQGNCGNGYIIDIDEYGCFECKINGHHIDPPPVPGPPHTGVPPEGPGEPPFHGVPVDPGNPAGPVSPKRPRGGIVVGTPKDGGIFTPGGNSDDPFGGYLIDKEHIYGVGGLDGMYIDGTQYPIPHDTPSGPTTPGNGPQLPKDSTPVEGQGEYNYVAHPSTNTLGELPNWAGDATVLGEGDGNYSNSSSKTSKSDRFVLNDYYGGRLPYAINTSNFELNNIYNEYVTRIFSPYAILPSENELGITTRHFRAKKNILNDTANNNTQRSITTLKNAITILSNRSYLESFQSSKSPSYILNDQSVVSNRSRRALNSVNQSNKRTEIRAARLGVHSRDTARRHAFGTEFGTAIISSYNRNQSIGNRTFKGSNTRDRVHAKGYELIKDTQDFTNRNHYGISVVPSIGSIGSLFYATVYVSPKDKSDAQTQSIELYIRDTNKKTELVAKTSVYKTSSSRRLASSIQTKNLAPGPATVYFVVKDRNDSVIFREFKNITLTSSGQIAGVPDISVNNSYGSEPSNFASGLIKESSVTSLDIPIDNAFGPIKLLCPVTDIPGRMKLGMQTYSLRGVRRHNIAFYKYSELITISSDNPEVGQDLYGATAIAKSDPSKSGPNMYSNPARTSAMLYVEGNQDSLPGIVVAFISNQGGDGASLVTIEAGGNFKIQPSYTFSKKDNLDGTYTVVVKTPFCLTDILVFPTSGNNVVSTESTITKVKTQKSGLAQVTITIEKGQWYGVALAYPPKIPISIRAFFFAKI